MSYYGHANPYGPRPEYKLGIKTYCESCDREFASKDWRSHEASKKHQLNKAAKEGGKDASKIHGALSDISNDASTGGRVDPNACHNCNKLGHKSKECPEPRSARNIECRKCNEKGHMAKDCPKGDSRACHNCGQTGHVSKECAEPKVERCHNCEEPGHRAINCPQPRKPRDWSKVKCRNCGEMGHGVKKCPEPVQEDSFTFDAGAVDDWQPEASTTGDTRLASLANTSSSNDNWEADATTADENGWVTSATTEDGW